MHIVAGAVLGVLILLRIVWRLTGGRRLPSADTGLLHIIAKLTHWSLYILIAAMVEVGLFLTWARGDSLFNIFSIPAFDPGNRALVHQVMEVHETIGWIIVVLAMAHAAAALAHRLLWHDKVLERMLPEAAGEPGQPAA